MKSLMIAAAALAVASVAVPAAAQTLGATTFYGNLGYSFLDSRNTDANLGAIGGKLGARFNPYLGAEVEAAFGVKDDTITVSGVPVKTKLQDTVAAYAVGFLPVKPNFDLFARVGYGNTKVKASVLSSSVKDNESAWNAGVGAQYFVTPKDGVRVEYTRTAINEDDSVEAANVWSVSYVRKF